MLGNAKYRGCVHTRCRSRSQYLQSFILSKFSLLNPAPHFCPILLFPLFSKRGDLHERMLKWLLSGPFFSPPPRTQGFTEKSGTLQLLSGRHLATTAPWLGSRGHRKSSEGSIHHEELCDCLAVWLWTDVSLYLWASIFRIKQGAGQGWAIPRAPMKGWAPSSRMSQLRRTRPKVSAGPTIHSATLCPGVMLVLAFSSPTQRSNMTTSGP